MLQLGPSARPGARAARVCAWIPRATHVDGPGRRAQGAGSYRSTGRLRAAVVELRSSAFVVRHLPGTGTAASKFKMSALRRLGDLRDHVAPCGLTGAAAATEEKTAKTPPARDHTPAEHQVVARRLGVKYGPVALVRGIPWIGAAGGATEALVLEHQEKIQLRDTDVWIATYPKCGTTWTHQIALLLLHNGESTSWGGDPHGFKTGELLASWPEVSYTREGDKFLAALETVPDPRVMKTHAPYFLLPGRRGGNGPLPCKAIYVTRNPKDACVSMLCT